MQVWNKELLIAGLTEVSQGLMLFKGLENLMNLIDTYGNCTVLFGFGSAPCFSFIPQKIKIKYMPGSELGPPA
jgi:hypothetical protein